MQSSKVKEVFTRWEYRGRRLGNPFSILLKLVTYPFILFFLFVAAIFVFIGFGMEDAIDFWKGAL